ncbi:MAG TPA: ferric reductase-like transmembrane domain-containing protein [Chloroflexota bacterium]
MNAELADNWRDTTLVAPRPRSLNFRAVSAWTFSTIVVVNALVIVWLWVYGKNISGVHGWGDLWTSVGRLTGLLSAYLALIQVLLLARLPWLERVLGFDHLTVWHRLNGKLCLYLVLAHVGFITIGYAAMDQVGIPTEASRLLTAYPGMIAATTGTVLLIAVVVTSLVIVRRRIRYEAWYAVHLTVYAGIALAWFHQIPTGNELTANPTAANYWTALYVLTAVLLAWFRLLIPIVQAFWYQMRVAAVIVEGPGVVSLRISGRHLGGSARAGQFFLWRFLSRGRWWECHPFSLSAAPDGVSLRITVKAAGDFTCRIGEIPVGARVVAEGPFGVFTALARRRERVLFIAGGVGITPIRAMLEEMSGDIAVIYRVTRREDLIFHAELEQLARERGITLHFVVGDHTRPEGKDLLSPAHLRRLVPDIVDRDIYVCGPPAMMRILERNLRRAKVARTQIHSERFAL